MGQKHPTLVTTGGQLRVADAGGGEVGPQTVELLPGWHIWKPQ